MWGFIVVLLGFQLVRSFPLDEYYVNYERSPTGQSYVYRYQPEPSSYYRQLRSDINKPMYVPGLGMKPQYHNLVFDYVKSFGGTEPPTFVNAVQPSNYYVPNKIILQGDETVQNSNIVQTVVDRAGVPVDPTVGTVMTKPQVNKYVLPSDISALPKSQIRGNVNSIKMKKIKDSSKMVTSLPPIGGVVSNYVLLRNQPNYQNLLRLPLSSMKKNDAYQTKRETFDEDDDSVVVVAEPLKSSKNNEKQIKRKEGEEEGEEGEGEEMTKNDEREEGDEKQELQPSIAQSKPSAIALAGLGGIAQASPMGTAVVGQGGLAVSAPSGTAIAGSTNKGVVPIFIGGKKKTSKRTKIDTDSDDEDD
uniref:Uncharacterized protein n=1 Tax=Pediculus humanus subsp. corporis TaxID=121224 RepID=A0A2Y9D483_PEDHC